MAPTARERLIELEKGNAPLRDQVEQACLFAAIPTSRLSSAYLADREAHKSDLSDKGGSHGRQEYVLRWLFKRFQDPETSRFPAAWRLLRSLVSRMPLRNVARVLNEKKFLVVLRQAVEDLAEKKKALTEGQVVVDLIAKPNRSGVKTPFGESNDKGRLKKRKRDEDVSGAGSEIQSASDGLEGTSDLLGALYETLECVVQLSTPKVLPVEAFELEYMKLAVRTTSDQAARILGGWLECCEMQLNAFPLPPNESILGPFIEIWTSRIIGPEDSEVFAKHCLRPLLALFSAAPDSPDWKAHLEKLLARNVLVPAKAAYGPSKDTELLESVVNDVVSENPLLAPIIFSTATRCILTQGNRPRKPHDVAWLQAVLQTLKNAMIGGSSKSKVLAMGEMLQCSVERKVVLDLEFLESVTAECGLATEETGWGLLATIIKADSNVFMLQPSSEALLKDLFSRITKAGTLTTWPTIADQVVDEVLVPLMVEFAKARQLSAFIQHWYSQLFAFETLRRNSRGDVKYFCAWEDDALQDKLKDIMEQSLTAAQIIELWDWLEEKLAECKGAVYVIFDAIAASVCERETAMVLKLEVSNLATYVPETQDLDQRYKNHYWRLHTTALSWPLMDAVGDMPLQENHSMELVLELSKWSPFLEPSLQSLEFLNAFQFLCAGWCTGAAGFRSDAAIRALRNQTTTASSYIKKMMEGVERGHELGDEIWGTRVLTTQRGMGWLTFSYVQCFLVEYPQALSLLEDAFLTNIVWIASATTPFSSTSSPNTWLQNNHNAFSQMWTQLLRDEYVLNNSGISRKLIDCLLRCANHADNPIQKSRACNGFVIDCLHQIPIEILSKRDRVAIMKLCPLESPDPSHNDKASLSYEMTGLDPAVLSLKIRMMQRPTLYDGIKFQDLIDLAEGVMAFSKEPKVLLPIYAEFSKLIVRHAVGAADLPRNREYVEGMINTIEKWVSSSGSAKKALSFAVIRLLGVVSQVLGPSTSSAPVPDFLDGKRVQGIWKQFHKLLLHNLQRRLQKPEKLQQDDGERCMSLYITMDVLDSMGVTRTDLVYQGVDISSTVKSVTKYNPELGNRVEFVTEIVQGDFDKSRTAFLHADIRTLAGRQAVCKKAEVLGGMVAEEGKLQLVTNLIENLGDTQGLDQLLALRLLIASCEDSRKTTMETKDNTIRGLSSAYTALAIQLSRTKSIRRFCLMIETMELILTKKPRTITQHNIDTTLSSITTLCSRHAPSLRSSHASTIYSHLVRLVHAILSSHRMKIQGHFHLVVQALVALLHCLFITSSSSPQHSQSHKSRQDISFPPWLPRSPTTIATAARKHTLSPTHASSFARLLTLISDPSASAVSRPSNPSNSLSSATHKAKALASSHMHVVLAAYIRFQLDLGLSLELGMREALVPGWWAVLGAMTIEGRRAMGEGLDSAGRVVLGTLVGDWRRWGRWGG